MTLPVSGVILAGGASRRMGHNKAFLELAGHPLIARIAEQMRCVSDEVIIAADDIQSYLPFADRCVPDVYPGVGTLGGIHAGLSAAAHDQVLVVACDMPFVNPAVLSWFVHVADGADLVVLQHSKGVEPLHALYRKSCLSAIESTIQAGERCAFAFYDQIRVRYVSPAEIASLDPELRSFRNLNSPSEWARALLEAGFPSEAASPHGCVEQAHPMLAKDGTTESVSG